MQLLTWEECNSDDEVLQREVLGLLYQLSKSPEGARIVESHGPTAVVTDLLRSKHRSISIYASGVLKNLQVDKPSAYRDQLDTEIESALGAPGGWVNDGLEPELFPDMFQCPGVDRLDQDHWFPPEYTHADTRQAMPNGSWFDTDL